MSELTPPMELRDPIHVEYFLDLAPTFPISPFSPPLVLHASLAFDSAFVDSETFLSYSHI